MKVGSSITSNALQPSNVMEKCATFYCNEPRETKYNYCKGCLAQTQETLKLRRAEKEKRRKLYTQRQFPKIAGDYADVTWEKMQTVHSGENCKETKEAIDGIKKAQEKLRGAYIFWGSHGTGKTQLAMLVLKSFFLAGKLKFNSAAKHPQFYMRAHAVRHYAFMASQSVPALQTHMLTAPVLVVDEIGKDALAGDYFTNFMFEVVDERASLRASSLLTIFIANTPPTKLATTHRFLASDRLILFTPIEFSGKSKRVTPKPLWHEEQAKNAIKSET